MKTTIATAEIFGVDPDGAQRRLTIAVGAPTRVEPGTGWSCRIAVADVLRPARVTGVDSFSALAAAVTTVRSELVRLQHAGWSFALDGEGRDRFDARDWPPA